MSDDLQTITIDPSLLAKPCVVIGEWNGRGIPEVRMGGRRFYLLADADAALGFTSRGVERLMRRNPEVFGAGATVLVEGADAILIARLRDAVRIKLDCDDSSQSNRGGARSLRLLTEHGMIAAWSLTADGQRAIVERFIGAVDPLTVRARALRDTRGDAGLSLVAPWETPAYLDREARIIDQHERRLRLAEMREQDRREQARLLENRRLAKLSRGGRR